MAYDAIYEHISTSELHKYTHECSVSRHLWMPQDNHQSALLSGFVGILTLKSRAFEQMQLSDIFHVD